VLLDLFVLDDVAVTDYIISSAHALFEYATIVFLWY